jgi:hypothetical protein
LFSSQMANAVPERMSAQRDQVSAGESMGK